MLKAVSLLGALVLGAASTIPNEYNDRMRCTSIGVAKGGMSDGSTITTHNNDCSECDLRVTHVPARDWPEGSKRPVFPERSAYPKYAEEPEYNIHGDPYLVSNIDTSIYNWPAMPPFFYLDQVEHTFGYTLGSYAIQNERQLGMGESTCRAVFYSIPAYAGGNSHLNVRTLMEVAMERCETARCAIILMGDLAVQYGFYGAGSPEDTAINQENEAGEALTISDPDETWMFHIMPDDTGSSAIWVAQRVPDGHITAVANQWVITSVNLNDTQNFMGSANLYDAAIRNNLWSPSSGEPFNFAKIYTAEREGYGPMCTRRVWRVFTLAAPSLQLSPYTDTFGSFGFGPDGTEPYPFSIKPDRPLTVQDIYRMNRDQYEGTQFDLTQGTDSGPFGDPMRWPATGVSRDPINGMTPAELFGGLGFPRAISLWRTAYSSITQARGSLAAEVGAITWIAPYAPHYSSFLPIYANANFTPSAIASGTQYKLDKSVNFWVHSLTSNYLSRFYRASINDTIALQKQLEEYVFQKQSEVEAVASKILASVESTLNAIAAGSTAVTDEQRSKAISARTEAVEKLQSFHQDAGDYINQGWWDYFWMAITKYRDIYKITNFHAESYATAFVPIMYPRWWMEQIGYWGAPGTPSINRTSMPIYPINVYSEPSPEAYKEVYPDGIEQPYPTKRNPLWIEAHQSSSAVTQSPQISGGRSVLVDLMLVSVGAAIASAYFTMKQSGRSGYTIIQDAQV